MLDYKTDFVKLGDEDLLIERHKPQLMLYKDALENGLNRKVDKVVIYSTSLSKEIIIEKNLTLNLSIKGNRSLISKAVGNLLSNAVHYSPEGERIKIFSKKEVQCIRLKWK